MVSSGLVLIERLGIYSNTTFNLLTHPIFTADPFLSILADVEIALVADLFTCMFSQ